jgi:hypothetical protein
MISVSGVVPDWGWCEAGKGNVEMLFIFAVDGGWKFEKDFSIYLKDMYLHNLMMSQNYKQRRDRWTIY